MLIKGRSIAINVNKYTMEGRKTPIFSCMGFLYGFHADVDIESEFLRCLEKKRYDVYGWWRWLFLRTYSCKFMWT